MTGEWISATGIPSPLKRWVMDVLGKADRSDRWRIHALAGDAGGRRYFRVCGDTGSRIAVHCPDTEELRRFLKVQRLLDLSGIRVPAVEAADTDAGFLLLEDLGDRLLLGELAASAAGAHYRRAGAIMLEFAAREDASLPRYDEVLLREELGRLPAWFAARLLDQEMDAEEEQLFDTVCSLLLDSALEQPRVLVHRDFHSRNLLYPPDGVMAVIDFQDAVMGPLTYDLVSLLRDCYIRWPDDQVVDWALRHRRDLLAAGLEAGDSDECFLRWFDLMGLQRHIKVLGTFARLALRDGKYSYLSDLPRVIGYVDAVAARRGGEYPELAAFRRWFRQKLGPVIERQPWWSGAA